MSATLDAHQTLGRCHQLRRCSNTLRSRALLAQRRQADRQATQGCRANAEVPDSVTSSSNGNGKKSPFDGRAFRRQLMKQGMFVRNPINDKDSLALMDEHGTGYSTVGLVAQMKDNGNQWQFKGITVKLANAFGYCWGVERAVQMAYEARRAYPGQKLHITNEIIHNPAVNQRLKEMEVSIIEDRGGDLGKNFDPVKQGDVVILPAFGASVPELRLLSERKVQIVDTTCPWVSKVWNAVDNQARKQHTSVIHGKYAHEETIATASFATTYIIVKDLKEAQYLADYIMHGGSREEFLTKFQNALSPGFDPDTDLERVGLANQTTMLRDETLSIGKLLEKTMMEKYGPAALKEHYMVMDTICDATQTRQSAVYEMTGQQDVPEQKLDMMLVVGGFNSSNTSHLQEIPEMAGIPSFWVNSAACINSEENKILHKMAHGEMRETNCWLPDGPVTIGITSGASTPDRDVEYVLDKVFRIRDPNFRGVAPRREPLVVAKPEEAEPAPV